MDYNSVTKQRFKELRPGPDGKLMADWQLTDTTLMDAVRITLPPAHAVPIIFVPGIMGSNLADLSGKPIWLLNGINNLPIGLAWNWFSRNATERQLILHPARTKIYRDGAVPKGNGALGLKRQDYLDRGWGEVSESSYHQFLVWLDDKMNVSRNPLTWSDFSQSSAPVHEGAASQMQNRLSAGVSMTMHGLPIFAEIGRRVEPISSNELLKRSKSTYPVYAFGYNWLCSNLDAATSLSSRIKAIIRENNKGPVKCTQVILVTHSMGGLVARACSQLEGMMQKIVGIVHGVMPATGAAVAYRRCKIGMRDESPGPGLVIGSDGKEVTAVFAQSPGALQLLPSEEYGRNWLQIAGPSGEVIAKFPKSDPYDEIYLQRDRWWSLVREDWLSPENGEPIDWDEFSNNIVNARKFHRKLAGKYHHNTFVFYGSGQEKKSFGHITWVVRRGTAFDNEKGIPIGDLSTLRSADVRTNGTNNLYVGGRPMLSTSTRGDASTAYYRESSYWEIRCSQWDCVGDGTVPNFSGRSPRETGGQSVLQQFELAGVEHEPAFRDYPVAQLVAYYAISKLAAAAMRP